jgi:hypothetical protein
MQPFVQDGLQRPIDVRFSPSESSLYILDFGSFEMLDSGAVKAEANSGKLWRCNLDSVKHAMPEQASARRFER